MKEMDKSQLKDIFFDEESKMIYHYRDLFSRTEDLQYIYLLCKEVLKRKRIDFESDWNGRRIVAFGTGAIAKECFNVLQLAHKEIEYFCNNNQNTWGKDFMGKEIISPKKLEELKNEVSIIIATSIPSYILEIKKQLFRMGFLEEDILFSCEDMGRQYFDLEELQLENMESFVDAGCFNGDDTITFLKQCKNVKQIYAFEPDTNNFKTCVNSLKEEKCFNIYPYGLWNKKEMITFYDGKSGSSHIENNGNNIIECRTLDEVLDGKEVSYIKMDIEGAEMNALIGSKKVIEKYKPKLAICVYHKAEDIYEIPLYLKKLVPEYKFYLRHYSLGSLETVLYAI